MSMHVIIEISCNSLIQSNLICSRSLSNIIKQDHGNIKINHDLLLQNTNQIFRFKNEASKDLSSLINKIFCFGFVVFCSKL